MVKGDTLFLANGNNSLFSVWDVSNPSTPVLLAQNPTVGFYSHNIWSSDDGNYITLQKKIMVDTFQNLILLI